MKGGATSLDLIQPAEMPVCQNNAMLLNQNVRKFKNIEA